jgi:tRNA (guanine37-N1)-methyltransferase
VVLGGDPRCLRVLLTPQGRPLTQAVAQQLAEWPRLLLVCGRYEGVDERVREGWIDEEISIGDYVLSGGEIPAMVLVDAVTRLLPGVLGNPASIAEESHSASLLEYPQYTRPEAFRGQQVPEVLQSGDHGAIAQWRAEQSHKRTLDRRPDLVDRPPLRENKE